MLSAFGTTGRALADAHLPDIPTIVISRGQPERGFPWGDPDSEVTWRQGHRGLIEHLSEKEHWIAEQAGHAVVLDQPDIVVRAVAAVGQDLVRARTRVVQPSEPEERR